MSAQVTEAHRELAYAILFATEDGHAGPNETAQLIADSEARTIAAAVAPLEARIKSDEELFHDIRMKLTASCGDPYKLHDEALGAIIAERDQLRADVERLTAELEQESKWKAREYLARAERAEAEPHALRLVCGTTDADKFTTWVDRANARAEEAEHDCRVLICQLNDAQAELAAERARLDWLEGNAGDIPKYNSRSFIWSANQNIRAGIDAAMKEGGK